MQSEQLKDFVYQTLDDMKAVDLQTLDVRDLTDITDYMIIASGTSSRHVKSLADKLVETAKQNGMQPLSVEGRTDAEWILVDLGDVVVHLMQPETREYYQLEKLWQQTTVLVNDARK